MNDPTQRNPPARRLGVRGHQKRSMLIASHKAGGAIFVESMNEATILLALDVDPRIRTIAAQPFTLRMDLEKLFATRTEAFQHAPRARDEEPSFEVIYTPDFLVKLASPTPLVIEAKSKKAMSSLDDTIRHRTSVLESLGYHYQVVSSAQVDAPGLHGNLVRLRDSMQFCQTNDAAICLDDIQACLHEQPEEFTLGGIRGKTPDVNIYLAILTGALACDLRSGSFSVDESPSLS